jgi:hypothetical protein
LRKGARRKSKRVMNGAAASPDSFINVRPPPDLPYNVLSHRDFDQSIGKDESSFLRERSVITHIFKIVLPDYHHAPDVVLSDRRERRISALFEKMPCNRRFFVASLLRMT